MANTIDDSSLYLSTLQNQTAKTGNSSLGKDEFLKILITQLQNQDPSNPMEDKDFIAQMATFSSLEQMTNMNTTMSNFISLQTQSNLISYGQFVGKEVAWTKAETGDNGETSITSGTGKVASIAYKGTDVEFTLEDGTVVNPGNISNVYSESDDNSLVSASRLIGKTVSYLNADNEEMSSVVKSVSLKNGQIQLTLDDDQQSQINAGKITKIE
ncbi:flagellar hook assembly protein FlgD [Niallia taxi]|uniref:flagellar hook assembly protein FlgD n=1 Tax=Niallia taxi TaxID=2499688 RepID=UPI0011A23E78|nr:flagellar hook assembly protein FlgD [Niallia taxi]MCT2344021.1 flagellar hook assembly protein FlgD [Niallia taxi]MDE5051499.1 flagellar hook assembly protein FlgD [Niallia taxi]MED3964763.1 flagellar hook assembly protein FlgD [Niallia taxi]WOD62070.1 flagellar hook assembly protein FlgD [Niallia taxi]